MSHIHQAECACGATVEISEYHLGFRGDVITERAPCPACGRLLHEVEIDGVVLAEVVFSRGEVG